jgi:hypothetical protein
MGKYKDNKYTIKELENEILADTLNNNLTEQDWNNISQYQKLTNNFINKYADKLS